MIKDDLNQTHCHLLTDDAGVAPADDNYAGDKWPTVSGANSCWGNSDRRPVSDCVHNGCHSVLLNSVLWLANCLAGCLDTCPRVQCTLVKAAVCVACVSVTTVGASVAWCLQSLGQWRGGPGVTAAAARTLSHSWYTSALRTSEIQTLPADLTPSWVRSLASVCMCSSDKNIMTTRAVKLLYGDNYYNLE